MSYHAERSPSSGDRWMLCYGSVDLCRGLPATSSEYADEGSAAHTLASWCLDADKPAADFIGTTIVVGYRTFVVDAEMAGHVQTYVNRVREYAEGNELYVEQALPIGHFTGEAGATGTGDAIIITEDGEEIQAHDLKYGMGVKVEAFRIEDGVKKPNRQLGMYLLGAWEKYSLCGDFKRFRAVIHQPRLGHISEEVFTREEMEDFRIEVSTAAVYTRTKSDVFVPGEKQCKFCKAKGTCKALDNLVAETVGADFQDLTKEESTAALVPNSTATLGQKMAAVDLIEDWCKAIRAKVEQYLLDGEPVDGYKLVEGRRGNRAWESKDTAEETLKAMRLKKEQMYKFTLISPTDAEKLLKKASPRKWTKIEKLITQSDGKPSVAPADDKRPALIIKQAEEFFEPIIETEDCI